jgi:hypothetical protein
MSNLEAKQHLLESAQHFELLAESEEAEAQKSTSVQDAKLKA